MNISRTELKEMAQRLELTYPEIAERAGVSYDTVKATMSGRRANPRTRDKIAEAIGVRPSQVDWQTA